MYVFLKGLKMSLFLFFKYMSVCLHLGVYMFVYIPGTQGGQKRALSDLELPLEGCEPLCGG